jgi:uncharacterized protein YcnI
MRRARWALILASLILGALAGAEVAAAHIIVDPTESQAGKTQLYTIVVPSEKRSDTVQVEVQFPRVLAVLQLQAPAGWKVTPERDGSGHILGALWEGGSVPFEQFVEFGVLAQNPSGAGGLAWSAVQTYADGSEVQWVGPETSQFPATVTHVRSMGLQDYLLPIIVGAALVVAIVALALASRARVAGAEPRQEEIGPAPLPTARARPTATGGCEG